MRSCDTCGDFRNANGLELGVTRYSVGVNVTGGFNSTGPSVETFDAEHIDLCPQCVKRFKTALAFAISDARVGNRVRGRELQKTGRE